MASTEGCTWTIPAVGVCQFVELLVVQKQCLMGQGELSLILVNPGQTDTYLEITIEPFVAVLALSAEVVPQEGQNRLVSLSLLINTWNGPV